MGSISNLMWPTPSDLQSSAKCDPWNNNDTCEPFISGGFANARTETLIADYDVWLCWENAIDGGGTSVHKLAASHSEIRWHEFKVQFYVRLSTLSYRRNMAAERSPYGDRPMSLLNQHTLRQKLQKKQQHTHTQTNKTKLHTVAISHFSH